ncbi:hypothetical protein [Glycomyces buryatensis]|uniref:hypothetical protein n=1 Tax=Glycomyces buryatensis TaxID=2570927 RepID=UPI001B3C155C|nr:hypothetical protein [Glycomyces buryatensis]
MAFTGEQQPVQPLDWSTHPSATESNGETHTVVFEVPADAREIKVLFTPAGELIEHSSGDIYQLREMPEITQWEVSF